MLTRKQHECLIFIDDYIKKTGFCPSLQEIATGMGVKSKSGSHRMLNALEYRGFIRRLRGHVRAIEVLKMPSTEQGEN